MTRISQQPSKGSCSCHGRKYGNQEARGGGAKSRNPLFLKTYASPRFCHKEGDSFHSPYSTDQWITRWFKWVNSHVALYCDRPYLSPLEQAVR